MIRSFLSDRLNVAWLVSAIVLLAVALLVPNKGAGTIVLIVLALPAIGLTGALRVRDGRRDRERKQARRRK